MTSPSSAPMLAALARALTDGKKSDALTESELGFEIALRERGTLAGAAERMLAKGAEASMVGPEMLKSRLQSPQVATESAIAALPAGERDSARMAILMQRAGLSTRFHRPVSALTRAIEHRTADLAGEAGAHEEGAITQRVELADLEGLLGVSLEQHAARQVLRQVGIAPGTEVVWTEQLVSEMVRAARELRASVEARRASGVSLNEAVEPVIAAEREGVVSLNDVRASRVAPAVRRTRVS